MKSLLISESMAQRGVYIETLNQLLSSYPALIALCSEERELEMLLSVHSISYPALRTVYSERMELEVLLPVYSRSFSATKSTTIGFSRLTLLQDCG